MKSTNATIVSILSVIFFVFGIMANEILQDNENKRHIFSGLIGGITLGFTFGFGYMSLPGGIFGFIIGVLIGYFVREILNVLKHF